MALAKLDQDCPFRTELWLVADQDDPEGKAVYLEEHGVGVRDYRRPGSPVVALKWKQVHRALLGVKPEVQRVWLRMKSQALAEGRIQVWVPGLADEVSVQAHPQDDEWLDW